MTLRRATTLVAVAGALTLMGVGWLWARAPQAEVAVEVGSESPYHVFPPGAGFSVTVEAQLLSGELARELAVQWVDLHGRPLSEPVPLPLGRVTRIASPSDRMAVGYYGLRLLPHDSRVRFNPGAGLRGEFGFGVLPEDRERRVDPESRFGIVHYDYRDPYLDPGWIKTATEVQIGWDGTEVDPQYWHSRLLRNREEGQIELPLIYGETWREGSLEDIRAMMRGVFRADPRFDGTSSLPAYELGLEENLRRGSFAERLVHTVDKFRVVKEERAEVDPEVRLAYQIAGTGLRPYRRLLESELGQEIDILSAHPYPWSDWPSPDEWHDGFVSDLRSLMEENGVDVPIWYTEVGSSQNDAGVPVMFSGRRPIGDGQTRAEYAAYMVKMHAGALERGIGKVFWYNYKDRDTSTTNAEDHFGMRDYWGHPKPGYLAYASILRCMKGRPATRMATERGVRAYRFAGPDGACVVAWVESDDERTLPLESVGTEWGDRANVQVRDLVGTPVEVQDGQLTLTTYPVFLHLEGGAAGA